MIKLIDDYVVNVDTYNYILMRGRPGKDKEGKEIVRYTALGYYSDLEKAVSACREELVRRRLQDRDMRLSEAVNTIRTCNREFREMLRERMKEVNND